MWLALAACTGVVPEGDDTLTVLDGLSPVEEASDTQTDRIPVESASAVDVLVAVDPHPAVSIRLVDDLAQLLNPFLGSGLDWRMGFVSTGLGGTDPGVITWIDEGEPNPLQVAGAMATPDGTDPLGALGAVMLALDGRNPDFHRGFAELHVVAAVSADDATPGVTPAELRQQWVDLGVDAFSVLSDDPVPIYEETALQFGGLSAIGEPDWAEALLEVGRSAAQVEWEFFLTQRPVAGSLAVEVHTQSSILAFEEDRDWTYDEARNSVGFTDYVPGPPADVVLTYEVGSLR